MANINFTVSRYIENDSYYTKISINNASIRFFVKNERDNQTYKENVLSLFNNKSLDYIFDVQEKNSDEPDEFIIVVPKSHESYLNYVNDQLERVIKLLSENFKNYNKVQSLKKLYDPQHYESSASFTLESDGKWFRSTHHI